MWCLLLYMYNYIHNFLIEGCKEGHWTIRLFYIDMQTTVQLVDVHQGHSHHN